MPHSVPSNGRAAIRRPGTVFPLKHSEFPNSWISTFPHELLVQTMFLASEYVSRFRLAPTGLPSGRSLQDLALVCKHWYNIIVSTPAFWTVLGNETHPAVLRAHLSHTGKAPIKFIRSTFTSRPSPSGFLKPILSEIHRLVELKMAIYPRDVTLVLEALLHRAPYLKDLELVVSGDAAQNEPKSLDMFGDGSCPPRLHSITLSGLRIPWTSPLLSPHVTSLTLGNQEPFESYKAFYEVFCVLRELRIWVLYDCLPPAHTESAPDLVLPKLHTLTLDDDDVSRSTTLLRHFQVPPLDTTIIGKASTMTIPPIITESIQAFSPLLKSSSGPSSHFCTCVYLGHSAEDGTHYIQYRCDFKGREIVPGATDHQLMGRFFIEVDTPLDRDMEAIMDVLPLEEVRSLTLDYTPVDEDRFWVEGIGRKIPLLDTMELDRSACVGFMRALRKYLDGLHPGSPGEAQLFVHLELIWCLECVPPPGPGQRRMLPNEQEASCLADVRRKLHALGRPYLDFRGTL
ncbi:hypothetical protein ONZ45_g10063 [Pleurotus djamor]|nr:hypothetical protein ONZ45_g10063 [Pleurotus djamor]